MAERKVVGRGIALLLGVVCIALAVSLVIALVIYLPMGSTIDSLNAEIEERNQVVAVLNQQITSLRTQIESLNNQISNNTNVASLQAEIASLESQIQTLYNVLYLNASAILFDSRGFTLEPSTNVTVWDQADQQLSYAGYVNVQVESSSNLTYVQVVYNLYGVAYDNVVTLGNGTAAFPVLPGNIAILVGNKETTDQVTGTITAIYHY